MTAVALCAWVCSLLISGLASVKEPAADAKPDILVAKDPRGFEVAFSVLFHAKTDARRRSSIADAKMIFVSLDKERPFRLFGSDEGDTAEGVMEKLDAGQAGKGRTAVVVAVEKAGAEKALLGPLMKHAEKFDIDVYRFGPVRREHIVKVPFELEKPWVCDPRFISPSLTLMWPGMGNGKRDRSSLKDALMIYSTVEGKHHILGIDREFSKEQIIEGLGEFYEGWKPQDGEATPPPAIVLGSESWGAGSDLYDTFQRLAKERQADIYLCYVCNFAKYPTSTENDKRLAELAP